MYNRGSSIGPTIKKIDRSSLIYLTKQLDRFLSLYKRNIFYATPENNGDKKAIETLEKYLRILKAERYDLLISDTSVINDDVTIPYQLIEIEPIDPEDDFEETSIPDDQLPF
jgi:hypothetical protein